MPARPALLTGSQTSLRFCQPHTLSYPYHVPILQTANGRWAECASATATFSTPSAPPVDEISAQGSSSNNTGSSSRAPIFATTHSTQCMLPLTYRGMQVGVVGCENARAGLCAWDKGTACMLRDHGLPSRGPAEHQQAPSSAAAALCLPGHRRLTAA